MTLQMQSYMLQIGTQDSTERQCRVSDVVYNCTLVIVIGCDVGPLFDDYQPSGYEDQG